MTTTNSDQKCYCVDSSLFANPNDYLKLVSAQIVLKVLNDSVRALEKSSHVIAKTSQQHVDDQFKEEDEVDDELATNSNIGTRKHFNIKRWHCISRPQYKYSCGISSLVSCWNYLYSTLGYGKLKPLIQEDALKLLGFKPPYDEIRFGPFTGNKTLMKWFNTLNEHFKVEGRSSFFYKPVGPNRTIGVTADLALARLKTLLKSKNHAFIYHCYNHYFCPVGFELEPKRQDLAYAAASDGGGGAEWLLIAETSRKYPAMHCIKWTDIECDLNTRSPEFFNVRRLDKGVQNRAAASPAAASTAAGKRSDSNVISSSTVDTSDVTHDKPPRVKKEGRNLHCFIMFQSFDSGHQFVDETSSDAVAENSDNITEYLNNFDNSDSE